MLGGALGLGAGLQVGSNECRVEVENHLPFSAGHVWLYGLQACIASSSYVNVIRFLAVYQLSEDLVSVQPCILNLHSLNRIRISAAYLSLYAKPILVFKLFHPCS